MNDAGAAVVVMARAPRPGQARRGLVPLLGTSSTAKLEAALLDRTVRWGQTAAPAGLHIAYDPPDAAPELRRLLGEDVFLFPQNGEGIVRRLLDASTRVFARGPRPLLIVWPEPWRWRSEHATAALADLAAGADVVLGPTLDGGLYLVGIAAPQPALFALPEALWRGRDVMALAVAAAREGGLEIGLLRAERRLHSPADVRAALVDPLLEEPLRRILAGGSAARRGVRGGG